MPHAARVRLVREPDTHARSTVAGENVLFALRYGAGAAGPARAPAPLFDVPNRVLGGEPAREVWTSERPVSAGRRGPLTWGEDGQVLFGAIAQPAGDDLAAEARDAYAAILTLAAERGYDGLHRLWNYVPGINDAPRGVERYRLFNAGRSEAFAGRFGAGASHHYPASSAVGAPAGALVVAFAACREPGLHLENPRQVSAWRYPGVYGAVSPTFARATLGAGGFEGAFLLSGTASVVGHETRHPHDTAAQVAETLANIEAMLDAASRRSTRPREALARFDLVKVYLRRAGDLDTARAALEAWLAPETPILWIEADICRADLTVEIEAVTS